MSVMGDGMREPVARYPARCTEADFMRVVKGAQKAGLEVAAYRIEPDGTIVVVRGAPPENPLADVPEENPWDD